ncbi:hypothetical protein EDD11_010042 [Mortierella claussenii]|nr:hypothetical protein EDD11_010042 [Mortierella claussenii]
MNLDECIEALPRIEKGLLRNIFIPIPICPEPYSLDLTQEYSRFTLLNQEQDHQRPSPSTQPRSQQQQQGGAGGSDGRYNCSVCKKSFGSEATWNNHQSSAKHLAAVKDAAKKNRGVGPKAGAGSQRSSSNNKNNNGNSDHLQEQDPPEVMEALSSFRKVSKIVKENPSMAASVLWKIAKALWSFRQSRETARALSLLIQTLSELQTSSSSTSASLSGAAAASAATSGSGSLTPTQISMTLYLSRLAIARLVVYQSPTISIQFYLDAVQGRWEIDPTELQSICEMVHTASFIQLLDHCKTFLSGHPKIQKLMTPVTSAGAPSAAAKKPTDPNLQLVTVLLEAASMLAQHCTPSSSLLSSSTINKEERIRAETSLGLLAMAVALTEASKAGLEATATMVVAEPEEKSAIMIMRAMSMIYRHLRMKYSAAACLLRIGELSLPGGIGPQDTHSNINNDDTTLLWDLFQALLLSMETGDLVRMQQAIRWLQICNKDDMASSFLDIRTIITIANAVILQDNDVLHNSASNALEHLLLLIQDGDVDTTSQLLICQYTTPRASIEAIQRLRSSSSF